MSTSQEVIAQMRVDPSSPRCAKQALSRISKRVRGEALPNLGSDEDESRPLDLTDSALA